MVNARAVIFCPQYFREFFRSFATISRVQNTIKYSRGFPVNQNHAGNQFANGVLDIGAARIRKIIRVLTLPQGASDKLLQYRKTGAGSPEPCKLSQPNLAGHAARGGGHERKLHSGGRWLVLCAYCITFRGHGPSRPDRNAMTPYAPLTGMLLSAAAFLFFTGFDTVSKYLSGSYSVFQIMSVEFVTGTYCCRHTPWRRTGAAPDLHAAHRQAASAPYARSLSDRGPVAGFPCDTASLAGRVLRHRVLHAGRNGAEGRLVSQGEGRRAYMAAASLELYRGADRHAA